jgi:hypothetical protein
MNRKILSALNGNKIGILSSANIFIAILCGLLILLPSRIIAFESTY